MEVLAARTEHCFIYTDRDQRGRNDCFLAKKRKMDLGFKEWVEDFQARKKKVKTNKNKQNTCICKGKEKENMVRLRGVWI